MSDKATQIANLLDPIVQALGLELLGVEYLPAPGSATLRLYIDTRWADQPRRPVNIEDCERVSREISTHLDVEDPIAGNYTLEVSSPGLDRPLFTVGQFARHTGESVKIGLRLPQNGRRRLQGRIVHVAPDAGQIVFEVDGSELTVAFENIDKARILPDWVALGLVRQQPDKLGLRKAKHVKKPSNKSAAGKPRAE